MKISFASAFATALHIDADAESQRDSGPKPKVATKELPWETRPQANNPNGVAAWSWIFDATPWGLKTNSTATAGWMTQSLWDC